MLPEILGVAGGLAAAGVGAWAALRARDRSESELELVDVGLFRDDEEAWPPSPPTLDVKLRNLGGQPAFLKRLDLEIADAASPRNPFLPWCGFGGIRGGVPASETYEALLPPVAEAAGTTVAVPLSQVIRGGDVDRFQVRLETRASPGRIFYRLRPRLVYDGRDRALAGPWLAVYWHTSMSGRPTVETPADVQAELEEFAGRVREERSSLAHKWPYARDEDVPEFGYFRAPEFWYPEEAMRRYVEQHRKALGRIIEVLAPAEVRLAPLDDLLRQARETLDGLDGLALPYLEDWDVDPPEWARVSWSDESDDSSS
ncbi:hypothetical protein [Bailinhaonella thermotolerans]|nr:hypothetical protein [Bailinhaonella thermotolerans]